MHWLVHVLTYHQSVRLLLIKHFVTFSVGEVAHVAYFAETEVVVEASLAGPVSNSLLVVVAVSLVLVDSVILAVLVGHCSFVTRLFLGSFEFSVLALNSRHMLWLSFIVIIRLVFLASEASLSTFEVVVLALAAFPSTIWEFEVVSLLRAIFRLVFNDGFFLVVFLVKGLLVKWSDSSSLLSSVSNLKGLLLGWVGGLHAVEGWEEHVFLFLLASKVINSNVVDGLSI